MVTIDGKRSYHAYIALEDSKSRLMVKTYSFSQISETVKISIHREPISMDGTSGYVLCEYGDTWWLALILESYPDRMERM